MSKRILPIVSLTLLSLVFSVTLLSRPTLVKSAPASHIVISEVKVAATGVADDEFVELYNPTDNAIDLTGWRLNKKSSSGGSSFNLVASISGTIPAHGFFLIAHPDYSGTASPDIFYSATSSGIATNNIVTLYSDAGTTIVDLIGMGTATASETATIANPVTNGSVERKAQSSSTVESMTTGSDTLMGNGEDTDNNSVDFILRETSDPQNSSSSLEILIVPTPTPTATPEPTFEPTPTPSPTPEPTATPTPQPTASPTPEPTVEPTPTATPVPTPTASPTPEPTITPTASPTPQPTTTPSPTPSPTPTPNTPQVLFSRNGLTCQINTREIQIRSGYSFMLRWISCSRAQG